MKIAVYTIAKNEEQFVERWAKSCEDADYRFILDTGSTDKTVAKARKAGVKVVSATISPWRFDDARNVSLALLPADIDMCVALDMDEVLSEGWRESLERLSSTTTRARYKYVWSWNEDGSEGITFDSDKIHARHGYRWKQPVHEVVTPDRIQEVQERCALEIHHHPDQTKSRGQYLPLLEVAVQEAPNDDRSTFYLAREYFFYGYLDKAKEMFETHLRLPSAKWGAERSASYRYLAKCDTAHAEEYLRRATQEAPGRREALVELAQHYYNQGDWDKCLHHANAAISIQEKPLDYLCEEFAWGALPHDLAAIAAYNLGMVKLAIEFTEDALEHEPDNLRLLANLEYYKGKKKMTNYPNWFLAGGAQQNFEAHLPEFKDREISVLQIGAYTGDATSWLLENLPDSAVTDVDTWEGSDEPEHKEFDWKAVETVYDEKVSQWAHRVTKCKTTSDAFFTKNESTFDFIYVDGDHTAKAVLKDALNAFNSLKVGGILAFDDYAWGVGALNPWEYPKTAIDSFWAVYQDKLEVLSVGLQLWLRKTSD